MKKLFSILLVLIVGVLMGWNMIYSKPDPFTLITGMFVWFLVCVVWIITLFKGYFQTATIYVTIIVIFGSAASAVTEIFEVATPLATVNIDNSTTVMPWPENPDPEDQATIDWMRKKTEITWSDFFEVSILGNTIGASSILLNIIIGWILLNIPWPKKVKRITIPFQVILLLVTIGFSIWAFYSPVTNLELDSPTKSGLNTVWWLGFTQGWWFPLAFTIVGTVINWANEQLEAGAENPDLSEKLTKLFLIVGTLFSAVTGFALVILNTTTTPTSVAWKICSDVFLDTAATNSMCFKANQAGTVAVFYLAIVWGWIITSIKKALGIR